MPLWSRVANVFRRNSTMREIDEEIASHLDEAIESGRDPMEARQAFGSALHHREASLDIRLAGWLDSLRMDLAFGWRSLWKAKGASLAAILSLGLALGSSIAAFRIVDALLLRPLPIRDAHYLYALFRKGMGPDGKPRRSPSWEYPLYSRMRSAAGSYAQMLAISYATRRDLTFGSDEETEKAYVQYVSGAMFDAFGIAPAAGRTLAARDDEQPGAHPVAVLSHDYWTNRFGSDPGVLGRRFRMGTIEYEVIGVAAQGFTGTEPGTFTQIFLPAMMHESVTQTGSSWLRVFALLRPGSSAIQLEAALSPVCQSYQEEMAKGFKGWPKDRLEQFLRNRLVVEPAAAGLSGLQEDYHTALTVLAVIAGLILSISCVNLANLMTVRAAARSREMAVRIAIGAGRRRLLQLVLAESGWMALAATLLGLAFSWWAAPWVVSTINPPDHPVRLVLPADLRVLTFAAILGAAVALLSGLGPVLRASASSPSMALRGGGALGARRRGMLALIAAQSAFCFLVLFGTGLFQTTFHRLSAQPIGFDPNRVLNLVTGSLRPQPVAVWRQVERQLQAIPGVETAALSSLPLLSGSMEGGFVAVNGAEPGGALVRFLTASPAWFAAMKIPLLSGTNFEENDSQREVAIVNQTFARIYFGGEDPVDRKFETNRNRGMTLRVIGMVRDARYAELREPMLPVVYLPMLPLDARGQRQTMRGATFVVRTSRPEDLALTQELRRVVTRSGAGFLVSRVVPQTELLQQGTIRERLLAELASFFSAVALLLAAVGLYGVLGYGLIQRRREFGIRIAIGAPARSVVRLAVAEGLAMVAAGAAAGLALAVLAVPLIQSLLYGTAAANPSAIVLPGIILFGAALVASVPAALGTVRIDPVEMLRGQG